jgi:hypothetical protein
MIYAARYASTTWTGSPAERFDSIADLGIRWALPFGIQRIELTVRAKSELDAFNRYQNHLGDIIAIYDSYCDRPVTAQVYEIVPEGRFVTYICAGPGKRLYDDVYQVSDMAASGDTDAYIKDVLTDSVTIVSTDQSNIDGSSVDIGGWAPDEQVGTPAGEAIRQLAQIGDASGNLMDFYRVDQPFSGVQLQAPLAYFKARSTTANPDWVFSRADLVPGGLTMSRHIWNLKRNVSIGWGRISGTHTGANNQPNLLDGAANFHTSGVSMGVDRVVNLTDGCYGSIAGISTTILQPETLQGGTDDDFDTSDKYTVLMSVPKMPASPSASTETDLWTVNHYEQRPEMSQTQAGAYEDSLLALFEKPVQQQSFVIGSPTIEDGNGAHWPLWRVFMDDSYYMRVKDLYPEAALFSASDDRQQSFLCVAMDYTYRDNRLRVVPSTGDSRLDVLLNQAGIVQGQIISTAAAAMRAGGPKPNPPPPTPNPPPPG